MKTIAILTLLACMFSGINVPDGRVTLKSVVMAIFATGICIIFSRKDK
jgi:hypothetical protein